jgi:hypothetical protein
MKPPVPARWIACAGIALAVILPHPLEAMSQRADTKAGPHFIRVLRHGAELEFDGEIVRGVARELREALASNSKVTVIHLNSSGGDIDEARKISRLIQERGLITVTNMGCMSACTLAFLAGRERIMSPGARIGFHQASAPHMTASQIEAYEKTDEVFMLAKGVPADFVKKAFSTPNSDIWMPTTQELKAAHIVTDIRGDFIMSGLGGETPEDQIEVVMHQDKLFSTIAGVDRDQYRASRAALIEALEGEATYSDFVTLFNVQKGNVLGRYLAQASDAMVRQFVAAIMELMRTAISRAPEACSLVEDKNSSGQDWSFTEATDGEVERISRIEVSVVKDGVASRISFPSKSSIASSEAMVERQFKAKHPDAAAAFKQLKSTAPASGSDCKVMVDFLDSALSLPDSQPIPFLRLVFAGQPSSPPPPTPGTPHLPPTGSSRSK